jgi:hypothetical protein
MSNVLKRSLLAFVALAWCGVAGCSSKPVIVAGKATAPTQENLMKIGVAYTRYVYEKQQPPKGPEDLKPLLRESGEPDKVLVSDRDNQPLVICWGIDTRVSPPWAKSPPVLAYEKDGLDGSRYVLTVSMGPAVALMSEREFRKASFPPDCTPKF